MPPDIHVNNNYRILVTITNNSNQYQIRPMRETDLNTVTEMDQTTWGDQSWSMKSFFDCLNDPFWNCWILESSAPAHLILGYGLQYVSNDISHIANLCIRSNQRGCGLGGILLRYMINYARQNNILIVELEVDTLNMHAFRLYVKHGFKIIQRLERYYSDTSDAYHMQLNMNRIY